LRNRGPLSLLRILSLVLIVAAIVLVSVELIRFSRVRAYLPAGLMVAGVPVGGLDRSQAAQRLLEVYTTPIELRYNGAPVQVSPSTVDFQIDVESMLAQAEYQRTQKLFWQEYWDYLWNRTVIPEPIPLSAAYSETRLRAYLTDLAQRYDTPPSAAVPQVGTVNFQPGKPGQSIDINASITPIETALQSLSNRSVDLPLQKTDPTRPAFKNLETLLKQTLKVANFEGLAGIYLLDLQTAQEMHFAWQKGQNVPVEPDIAFTASSTIKIPIMVSTFRRMSPNPDSETTKLLSDMVDKSGNEAADWLMNRVVDPKRGPLLVSEDMKSIGLKNTFLAGYFSVGSPILQAFKTPANSRKDINTDPDPYSQTTISDLGMILTDLYQCSQNGGGTLPTVFPGEMSQAKCQQMVNYLIKNRLPVLITAGIPEGTQIAHKHGWVTTNGIINTIGDAAIVYSPGGNYVLVIFLHHPDQLIWEPASDLVAELSRAVYNYYNLSNSN
jgi:beta-lactamase class A